MYCSVLTLYFNIADNLMATKWIPGSSIQQYRAKLQQPWLTMNEWILMNMEDQGQSFSPSLAERGRREAPRRSRGRSAPLSIFRIFWLKFRERYQSHFEAPDLHLFVRDVRCSPDDCANSSKATYSRDTHCSVCFCCLG